jgi:hypothetical protein
MTHIDIHHIRRIPSYGRYKKKRRPQRGRRFFLQWNDNGVTSHLQSRLNLKSPGLEQRLGNILRILIPSGPFTKSRRSNVLVRCQLELFHNLLERCYRRDNRPYRLRLAPVGISTTLCHIFVSTSSGLSSAPRPAEEAKQEKLAIFILRQLNAQSKRSTGPSRSTACPIFCLSLLRQGVKLRHVSL